MRLGFGIGEWVAPGLSARAAQKLWLSVPAAPPFERRNRGLSTGDVSVVEVGGTPVRVHSWGEGPAVLLVHGWSGWYQQYAVHVQPLVDAGMRVLAWDAPSHGETGPGSFGRGRSGITDLRDAVLAVGEWLDEPVRGVVAHSGGAMASVLALLHDGQRPLQAEKAVLLAPSVDVTDMLGLLKGRLHWGDRTARLMLSSFEREFDLDMGDFNLIPAVEAHRRLLPEVLFLHDVDDPETPVEGAHRLAAVWPGARVETSSGLGHHRILWADRTVKRVVEFLAP